MTAFIIILAIIALPFILALFIKKNFSVESHVHINRPKQDVFNYIKYVRNSENYSKWVMIDPNARKTSRGVDGTVGFVYGWDSDNKKVGQGEQEIVDLKDGVSINYDLRFIKPWKGNAKAFMETRTIAADQTQVSWAFFNTMKYPMNLLGVLMNMEKMLKKDMDASLTNLKVILEKQPETVGQ